MPKKKKRALSFDRDPADNTDTSPPPRHDYTRDIFHEAGTTVDHRQQHISVGGDTVQRQAVRHVDYSGNMPHKNTQHWLQSHEKNLPAKEVLNPKRATTTRAVYQIKWGGVTCA